MEVLSSFPDADVSPGDEAEEPALDGGDCVRREQAIAENYMGGTLWTTALCGLGNLALWLSLWPLVLSGWLPLWAGAILSTALIVISYLPSHEAIHDILARPGSRNRWVNELVGHLSMLPLVLPYRVAKFTHLEHHRNTNDPVLDPDFEMRASGPLAAIWKHLKNRQPGSTAGLRGYPEVLRRLGRPDLLVDGAVYAVVYYGILCGLAWTGYGIEALLLWWLPRHVASSYILFFLSWAPHHTDGKTGRYRGTRMWKSRLGNIGSLGMQFHLLHHLYPAIPLTRHPAAFEEMRPLLEARGCDLGGH